MRLPNSAIVFSVLNLIFGSLGLCGGVFGLVISLMSVEADDPLSQIIRGSLAAQIYMLVGQVISLLGSGWLIASGIGLLLRQPWACTGSVIYGWFSIVQVIVNAGLYYALLFLPLKAELERTLPPDERFVMLGLYLGVFSSASALSVLYASLLIYFLSREPVRRAFGADGARLEPAAATPRSETGNPYQSPS